MRKLEQLKEKNMKSNKATMILLFALLVLSACSGSAVSNFPTGRFVVPDDKYRGIDFNKDGTFVAFYAGEHLAEGTYRIKGDTFIETSNDQDCPSPMSYKYSFDGANLTFQLTDQSKDDPCVNRKAGLNNATYVLTK